eukprot:gene5609-189_t
MDFTDSERYKVGDQTIAQDIEQLKIIRGDDPLSATFVIGNEDHTLGNSLRWIINKDPRVEFCGYSQPHPSDKLIKLRIQPKRPMEGEEPLDATEILRDGLRNMMQLCDHLAETVRTKSTEFREKHGLPIPMYDVEDDDDDEDMEEEEDYESQEDNNSNIEPVDEDENDSEN